MTNEEKFKTPEERNKAYREFCDSHICDGKCPCHKSGVDCRFLWLSLEVEKEKPMPCKCCGGEAVVVQPWTADGASVMCKKCGVFVLAHTKADAIAAWNRRVK